MSSPSPVPDPTASVSPHVAPSVKEEDPEEDPNDVLADELVSPEEIIECGLTAEPTEASDVDPAQSPTDELPAAAGASASSVAKTGSSKSKKKKSQVTVTMATAATAQANGQGGQGENTGRWTAEEHRLFLQGLEQHGKGWKKIASLIKSRTVVQIRTHAQKYFQKLAKARQNGEEGEVAMEGRGGAASVPSVSTTGAQSSKRRRQTSGTKRKAIQSVVASAQRQGKKIAAAQAASGVPDPTAPLPCVAPALAPYVLPASQPPHPEAVATQPCVPSITTAQGTISGPALEDSLFRFLTPAPVLPSEPQVNEVARQAGANPITVPSDQHCTAASIAGGEVSPTGVSDFTIYPSWTDAKDTPSWYAKGSDVDALLDVADTLDWLTDTGDLHEAYQPTSDGIEAAPSVADCAPDKQINGLTHADSVNNMSMNTLPHVDSVADVVVPPLPSLFDGTETDEPSKKLSESHLVSSSSSASIDEHLQVFENPLEEHEFVSSMLEDTAESSASLPLLQ